MPNNGNDGWQSTKGPKKPPKYGPGHNPRRGEVLIEIAGKLEIASINFERASQLIALFSEGQDETTCNFGSGFMQSWYAGDLDKVSAAIAILTGKEVQEIYDASPPWDACLQTMTKCYNLFFWGTQNPPERSEEVGEASDPLANGSGRTRGSWSWLWNKRSRRASNPTASGNTPSGKSANTSSSETNGISPGI